jgi:hypothetical protein
MTVQLTIPFETLVELVEQLPAEEQLTLIERIQHKQVKSKRLSDQLLIFQVGEWPSHLTLRREDEYAGCVQ